MCQTFFVLFGKETGNIPPPPKKQHINYSSHIDQIGLM